MGNSNTKSSINGTTESPSKYNKKKANGLTIALSVFAIIFGISMFGIAIWFSIELEKTRNINSKNCNKPAGEFAVEPRSSLKDNVGILNECTYGGLRNQPCEYNASNINEAIDQCNRLADVCNRFVFIPDAQKMQIIGLNVGFENIVINPNASIYTRQIGVTFSGSGSVNNTNSGGFSSRNVTFDSTSSSSQFSSGQIQQNSNTVTGGSLGSYY